MKKVDALILAYLAGVMDADGCLTILKHKTNSKYPDCVTYSECVSVGQTSNEAVTLLQELFGGTINLRTRREGEGRWKPMYYWVVNCKIAAECVTALRPYLRVKARQADLLLTLRASKDKKYKQTRTVRIGVRWRQLDPAVVKEREDAYAAIRALNGRNYHKEQS